MKVLDVAEITSPFCFIADKDQEDLKFYSYILEKNKTTYVYSEDGLEALEKLEVLKNSRLTPDIFIINPILLKVDGVQLMENIRDITDYKNVPIIVVCEMHSTDATQELIKDFDPCLLFYKPLKKGKLTETLNNILS